MAGMQITPVGGTMTAPVTPTRIQSVAATAPESPQKAAEKKPVEKEEKEPLKDVVSVSEDGDTVQVVRESEEKLEDELFGRVDVLDQELSGVYNAEKEITNIEIKDPDEEEEEDKALKIEEEPVEEKEIQSYAGYTDQQLEQMYLKGEISKQDYDSEMELRESREAEAVEEDEENARLAGKMAATENMGKQDEIELKKVFSEDASDTFKAGDRAEIIDTLENLALGITN